MKRASALAGLACVLWFFIFFKHTGLVIPFWPAMFIACGVLAGGALLSDRKELGKLYTFQWWYIPVGIVSALILYGVFWVGHFLSTWILPFAGEQVDSIYMIRGDAAKWKLAMLLFFWIGPAEEIFWRGYLQRHFCRKFHPFVGFVLVAGIYTVAHVWSMNFMLLAAAAICGGFWGLMFLVFRSPWPGIVSHAVWDVVIFILWPIS